MIQRNGTRRNTPPMQAATSNSSLRWIAVSIGAKPGYSSRMLVVLPTIFVSLMVYGVVPTIAPSMKTLAPGGLERITVEDEQAVAEISAAVVAAAVSVRVRVVGIADA